MISTLGHTLSHFHIVVAWLIFLASYLVFAIGHLPGTKIDRPAMAVIGAVGMFVFGVLTPKTAIESIDFATLVLLFSMMLIVASLHLSGFFEGIAHLVIEHLSPRQLLPGVVFTSGDSVGVPGERCGLPGHGAAGVGRLQENGPEAAALPARPGDGFQPR